MTGDGGWLFRGSAEKIITNTPPPRIGKSQSARSEFFGSHAGNAEKIKAIVEKLKGKNH